MPSHKNLTGLSLHETKVTIVSGSPITNSLVASAAGILVCDETTTPNMMYRSLSVLPGDWVAVGDGSGSGGLPGGADTQVQFNAAGVFGGDSGLTFDSGSDALSASGSLLSPSHSALAGEGNGLSVSANSSSSGAGGSISITAGAGPTQNDPPFSSGGSISLAAGAGNGGGGALTLSSGSAQYEGSGGIVSISSGSGPDGGGPLSLSAGGSSESNGGAVSVTGGSSGNGSGGNVNITAGVGSNAGGILTLSSGNGSGGTSGNVNILCGSSDGQGGGIFITSGAGNNGNGGGVTISAGTASFGTGGETYIVGGASNGAAGNLVMAAGSNTNFENVGGNVIIQGGEGAPHGYISLETGMVEKVRIDAAGNVGIGTGAPVSRLQVRSPDDAQETNIATFTSNNETVGIAIGYLHIRQTEAASALHLNGGSTSGGVNIGDVSPGPTTIGQAGGNTVLNASSGNVGVGTASPGYKLHVVGSISLNDGSEAAGYVLTSDANGLASWQIPAVSFPLLAPAQTGYANPSYGFSDESSSGLAIDTSAGLVTLNSETSQGLKLSTGSGSGSSIQIQTTDGINMQSSGCQITTAPTGSGLITLSSRAVLIQAGAGGPSGASIELNTSGNQGVGHLFIDSAGLVGINTTSPGATLHVAGQIKIGDGNEGAGKVLTSDSQGLASWQAPNTATVKVTKTYADFAAAATTSTINLVSLPAGAVILAGKIKHTASFTGGTVTEVTITVGDSNWVNTVDSIMQSEISLFDAPSDTDPNAVGSFAPSVGVRALKTLAPTQTTVTINTTGDNVDQLTAGSVDIWITYTIQV